MNSIAVTSRGVLDTTSYYKHYSIQLYVIKFISGLGRWLSPGTSVVFFITKTDRQDMIDTLFKMVLNIPQHSTLKVGFVIYLSYSENWRPGLTLNVFIFIFKQMAIYKILGAMYIVVDIDVHTQL